MDKLNELRQSVDKIDDKIAQLFNERMNLVKAIGEEKAISGSVIVDPSREKNIVNRVTGMVDEDKIVYTKQVYQTLFDVSKAYQTQLADVKSPLKEEIDKALERQGEPFPVRATVACQGVEGAYSMLAAERLFPVSDIMYFKDWNGVFTAIEKGLCRYGILPIENSTAGSVNKVYDLILKHKFFIVRSLRMQIRHSLLVKKGTDKKDVRVIYSHEQAVSQCSELIKQFPLAEIKIVENTATASKLVAGDGDKHSAAISSPECAELYGLTPLMSNVQNANNNYTRFICICKDMQIYDGADKISIVLSLPHVTGSLNKMLAKFNTLGLNLTKLESRPIADSEFEFNFYFDFEADVRKKEVRNLISELSSTLEYFAFLGCYEEVR